MAHLDHPLRELWSLLKHWLDRGAARALPSSELTPWPEEKTLLLRDDTAIELGSPDRSSITTTLWTQNPLPNEFIEKIYLIGPDLDQIEQQSASLGRVIIFQLDDDDEYSLYLDVIDRVCSLELRGVSARARPSHQHLWLRVSHDAKAQGLSVAHLGQQLLRELRALEGVVDAAVIFVVDSPWALDALRPIADQTARAVNAMIKAKEEDEPECDDCEFSDICDDKERP